MVSVVLSCIVWLDFRMVLSSRVTEFREDRNKYYYIYKYQNEAARVSNETLECQSSK